MTLRAVGPVVDPVPCSGCGKRIDPLRAGHVAIFDLRVHFFCDRATCRATFLGYAPGTEPARAPGPGGPAAALADARRLAGGGAARRLAEAGGDEAIAEPSEPESLRLPLPPRAPDAAGWPVGEGFEGDASADEELDAEAGPMTRRSNELARAAAEPAAPEVVEPPALARAPAEHAGPIVAAYGPADDDDALPKAPPARDDRSLVEPIARTILTEEPSHLDAQDARDVGALLLALAIISGILAVALTLAGESLVVIGARIVLAVVGVGMLLGRAATTARDATEAHPAPLLAGSVGAVVVAVWAAFGRDRALAAEATSLAGFVVAAVAVASWLLEAARHAVEVERAWVAAALAAPGRRVVRERGGAEGATAIALDLRAGEEVVVEAGELVPVDLTVTGGEVELLPWMGAATSTRRRDGDAVVAGARVVRGRLRGTCTWAGNDRAFARVLLDPRRRADALAPVAHASRALVERWAVAAAGIAAISAGIAHRTPVEVAMIAVAVHAALATPIAAAIAAVHVARGILLGLRRGVSYRSADAWDRAARVDVAMFCARGTLLLGEPELAELEALSPKIEPADVLALAAGAERAEDHPVATAIVRAARARGVRPDGVRNPGTHPGLGVTAVASGGDELVVGSRTLLLDQRISIASAEQRIAELEGLGRTVVLVALGGRVVGLIGLSDGLRPGARAAVQHLLDAQIEPVLVSGDARETCEAIGRSLDIDHIRPEVLPGDRAAEVKRLAEAGTSVAVLGHPGVDDGALGAADVSVALAAAGSTPGEFAVSLASDDVRDAALSLALAKRTRLEARVALAMAVVPALVGSVAIAFGILPPAYAPIASLLGGAMAVVHARALDRLRTEPAQAQE
jgi:Cu+-exporting ATPase